MADSYYNEVKIKYTLRLRELLKDLPEFLGQYFRGINDTISPRTKLGYAYDLRIFFMFLLKQEVFNSKKNLKDFNLEDLNKITSEHVEIFLEYVSYYEKVDREKVNTYINEQQGKMRKLSAIRAMFQYFYKRKKITVNETLLVEFPKVRQKEIVRLEYHEVEKLLKKVETGDGLTATEQKFHSITVKRDLAIIMLLLGTGMRVSECVGINIEDIDVQIDAVKITRKGGNEARLYFNEEVKEALNVYLEERKNIKTIENHEEALFLSIQKRRITDRSVQKIVKKYSKLVTSIKNISPHKLRSTFGSNLYQETNDIYLVADLLGHADVNTTRRHYAKMQETRRMNAVKYVKLRE